MIQMSQKELQRVRVLDRVLEKIKGLMYNLRVIFLGVRS